MSASTSQATSANTGDFFNLHTLGIGYLNRVRRVPVKGRGRKAEEFLACSIAAMRGLADDLSYTYFDCRVSGAEAQEIVEKLMEDVEQNRKVVIGFCIGDTYPHLYERDKKDQEGQKTGEKEWAALIKGRLLRIDFVTIDGQRMYTRKANDAEGNSQNPPQQSYDEDGDQPGDELPAVQESRREPPKGEPQDRSKVRSFEQRGFVGRESAQAPQHGQRQRFDRDAVPA